MKQDNELDRFLMGKIQSQQVEKKEKPKIRSTVGSC
ncbi:hypothetical protein J2Y02_002365 [Neobacillus drentensis]|nr:hypothetical protein [Neobacillus drentensis]